MRFAFSKPTSDAAQQQLLFENFRRVGFDGLQLKPNQYSEFVDSPQHFIDRWGKISGVSAGLITAGVLDEDGQKFLRRVIKFASYVGAERVIFCHTVPRCDVSHREIKCYARVIEQLGTEAIELGTKLSLHHHYNQPVMHEEDIELFVNEVNPERVGLTIDTAHLVKSGVQNIPDIILKTAKHIDNFHLKDFSDGHWRILGHGEIDFSEIAQAIQAINYDGWLSADEETGSDPISSLEQCYSFIRQLMIS